MSGMYDIILTPPLAMSERHKLGLRSARVLLLTLYLAQLLTNKTELRVLFISLRLGMGSHFWLTGLSNPNSSGHLPDNFEQKKQFLHTICLLLEKPVATSYTKKNLSGYMYSAKNVSQNYCPLLYLSLPICICD